MQHVFVDFGRGIDDAIDLLMTARPNAGMSVQEGERIIVYDSSLEVEGIAHQGVTTHGDIYWFAIPDWATSKDLNVAPSLQQAGW